MKKGVSAVIAVILILMITVALAAMAYVWFTNIFETISTGAGDAATGTTTAISTSFKIESAIINTGANTTTISIRNTGSVSVSDLAVYLNGVFIGENNTTIATGKVSTINIIKTEMLCGAKLIKVTSGTGYEQQEVATCS